MRAVRKPHVVVALAVDEELVRVLVRARIAVEEWLRVIPDFGIAAEDLSERGGSSMMTLTSLPLAWEAGS